MSDQPLQFAKSTLAYAKLVATPTQTAWAQVYNAGNLFACLELTNPDEQADGSLGPIGKDLFNALEAEFFTLEEKTLASISQAILTSLKDVPEDVTANLALAFFKEDILYLFIAGAGKIMMKRNEQIGVLLEKTDGDATIATASGYLSNKDIVILQTNQFSQNITSTTLASVLDLALPSDIAEALSPSLHAKEDGGQAAIIIAYHGPTQKEPEVAQTTEDETLEEKIAEEQQEEMLDEELKEDEQKDKRHMPKLPKFNLPKVTGIPLPSLNMNGRKKFFLLIFVVLIVLLVGGIFFTKNQEESKARHARFLTIYNDAEKKYEEGKALKGLNDTLANQDLTTAQQSIKDALPSFPKGTDEEKKLTELSSNIDLALGGQTQTAPTETSKATAADFAKSTYLKIVKDNPGLAYGQTGDTVYVLSDKTVTTINKATESKKDIISGNKTWMSGKAVVPYQGNVYVLDANGVLKFTIGSDGFGKTDYFKSKVDTSKAVAMAIDGSVWLVTSDGAVQKFTKGVADTFKITGLAKPLSHPTGIVTTIDTTSVYILDTGNSRIVKLSKDGTFQSEYATGILANVTAFEVSESDKKIYVLAQGKLWEIPL